MILENIQKELQDAIRRQDPLELKTLRYILSEINYAKIDKQADLSDEEIVSLLQKEVKKRKEAIELMKKGGRDDLVKEEQTKLTFIDKYLPKQLTNDELTQIVKQTKESMPDAQMGQLIGAVMQKVKGKADGKLVAEMVRKTL